MDLSKFIMLAYPKHFDEHFKNDNYDMVQVFSTEPAGDDIVGFVGQFSWINRELKPLDGDSYNKDVLVIGYKEWYEELEEGNINGIDILVGDDW